MSPNGTPVPASKLTTILDTANTVLQLSVVGGGLIVPFIKGAIMAFKELRTNSDGTVDYAIILKTDGQLLDDAKADLQSGQSVINAELQRLGKDPVTLE